MRIHDMQVEMVELTELHQHPDNANNGDIDALTESIEVNGFYSPIFVQRSSGRIIAGNHRYHVAMSRKIPKLPVIYLDVSDEAAKRMMLADNSVTRKGHDDEGALLALLQDLYATDISLTGTGYNPTEMLRLDALINEPLDFDAQPVEETRKEVVEYRTDYSVYPVMNEDGDVTELTILKEGMGSFSRTEANHVRRLLGLANYSKDELHAMGVDKWR